MTKTGAVCRWDAARGFGFIRSPDTATDIFFHVRDFHGTPAEGMAVRFEEIHIGGKGPRAMAVAPCTAASSTAKRRTAHDAGASSPARGRHRAPSGSSSFLKPVWWLVPLWLALLGFGVWSHRVPWSAVAVIGLVNIATFVAYAFDKNAAQQDRRRTPEQTLHLLALAGGWPAARWAQQALRHKSRKVPFQNAYIATVVLHTVTLMGWIFWIAPRWAL